MAIREENGKLRVDIARKGMKRHTKTFPLDQRDKAERHEKDVLQQLLDGKPLNRIKAKTQITLREAFENTMNNPEVGWLGTNGEPTSHGKKMQYYAKMFYKYFGASKLLREIKKGTATMEGTWYHFISQFGESNTNNRKACCINKIFRQALDDGHITSEYLLNIPRKTEKLTRVRTFSEIEEEAIYTKCDELGYYDLKDFVILLIDTGARPEELRTATLKDLQKYPDGGVTVNFYRNKTNNDSLVGIRERSQKILIRRSNQKRFFMSSYRQLYTKWNDVRDRLDKSDDPQWTFYTCRHTCASRLATQAGATLTQISDWLGHSPKSQVTRRYIHFFPKDKVNLARKLDNYEKKLVVVKDDNY